MLLTVDGRLEAARQAGGGIGMAGPDAAGLVAPRARTVARGEIAWPG